MTQNLEYKALTPTLIRELDERIRRMWYAPNIDMGLLEADDLITRVRQCEKDGYIGLANYSALAYYYGKWLIDSLHCHKQGKVPCDDKA